MMVKIDMSSPQARVRGRLGPTCIACGNSRQFWILTARGEELFEILHVPDGELRVIACGRCQSKHSIVIAHLD